MGGEERGKLGSAQGKLEQPLFPARIAPAPTSIATEVLPPRVSTGYPSPTAVARSSTGSRSMLPRPRRQSRKHVRRSSRSHNSSRTRRRPLQQRTGPVGRPTLFGVRAFLCAWGGLFWWHYVIHTHLRSPALCTHAQMALPCRPTRKSSLVLPPSRLGCYRRMITGSIVRYASCRSPTLPTVRVRDVVEGYTNVRR